ncbi:MAG: TRL-like family protein [Leptospira sp.]|nr:TRL-like family protein [Leptospira sp.]
MKLVRYSYIANILLFFSCAHSGFGPNGLLLNKTKVGMYGTGKQGSIRSEACAHSYLGLISLGSASIEVLKAQSKINVVTETNWKTFSILGLYSNLCVEIYGD